MFIITLLDPTQTKSNLLLRWKIKLDRKGVTPVLVFPEASINLEKLHVLAKISSKQKSRSSVPVFFHAESLLKAADFLLSDRIPKGEKILPVFVDFGSIGKDKNGTDFEEQVEILQRKIERNFSAICFLETGKAQASIERSGNRNWLFHKSSLVVGIEGRSFKILRKDLPQAEEGELSAESWIPGGLLEGGHSENNLRF
ncbi:hypothetical protein [Leptospira yasudae]|uniref:Uncharacterized protein n=1 Tax=Leptospira yasudae TaxID=2202201 RepID=A0A6N4QSC2_9LEPT|nr:hypothetical protein [Leptospira yasudae]TGL73826.1 hypothetical protein EHQ72_18280 [Leptospira yasudae]TGL79409.1 hypothetical protein EHQ77_10165 [Leptospira yasudae]TGL85325.1 hypothetical protein EHQ83_08435 [Leptospira yasudae]